MLVPKPFAKSWSIFAGFGLSLPVIRLRFGPKHWSFFEQIILGMPASC